MIKRIRLTNFFSFKDETIDFEKDVNLLVGINGSGKSNLFKAIQLLKIGVTGNSENNALFRLIVEEWGGFDNIYFKGKTEKNGQAKIGLEFVFDASVISKFSSFIFLDESELNFKFNNELIYKIEIIKKLGFDNYFVNETIWEFKEREKKEYLKINSGHGFYKQKKVDGEKFLNINVKNNDSRELALSVFGVNHLLNHIPVVFLKEAIKTMEFYEYLDTTKNSKIRSASSTSATIKKLLPDGKNLPQLLHTLKLKNKSVYRRIVKELQDINPNFSGFDFNVLGSGQMEVYLDENKLDSAIHLAHVSDGTLRYLCLLSIFLNPNRGSLICIDEPEIGLHPDMIFSIFKLIEEASSETTFLISTHSPAFLNKFRIKQIRVLEKNEDNETIVNQFSEDNFEGWYEEFNPGKMWTSGDFGGTRW